MTEIQKQAADAVISHCKDMPSSVLEEYMQELSPPDELLIELKSKVDPEDTYKTMPFEIQEYLMRGIFGKCGPYNIGCPIILSDKNGRYAVTVITEYWYIDRDGVLQTLPGIASEVAGDITMLSLISPKAATMGHKNALKQRWKIMGRGLNKEADTEAELPLHPIEPKYSVEEKEQALAEEIMMSKTVEELKTFRKLAFSKGMSGDIQAMYENKYQELKSKK